jgi:diadenosine tetraphosphate (Ap4A) HIT family hydrolase
MGCANMKKCGSNGDVTDQNHTPSGTTKNVLVPLDPPTLRRKRKSSFSISRLALKGVAYNMDGSICKCRFCSILSSREEKLLYEDSEVVVFRPIHSVTKSHILIVPRLHIRNIDQLTKDNLILLQHMRHVAEIVLRGKFFCEDIEIKEVYEDKPENDSTWRNQKDIHASFHLPPFNSIDHVHMHAFWKSKNSIGCLGRIKYRTETWWCRSYDRVVADLSTKKASENIAQIAEDYQDHRNTKVLLQENVQQDAHHEEWLLRPSLDTQVTNGSEEEQNGLR